MVLIITIFKMLAANHSLADRVSVMFSAIKLVEAMKGGREQELDLIYAHTALHS